MVRRATAASTTRNGAFHACDQCTHGIQFIPIFLCVYGLTRTLRVTVKTFCTRVPILRLAIDLVVAAIAASTGEIPRAGDISNAFVKQSGLHSRIPLHNEYRVTGYLKSLVLFEMYILDSEKFNNFETVCYNAERELVVLRFKANVFFFFTWKNLKLHI